jgi:hypothetical protein
MRVISRVTDARISAESIFLEMSYGEYLNYARDIIRNNELQRRRVKSSITVYSLLKNDLKTGCIMPPIVLALGNGLGYDFQEMNETQLLNYVEEYKNNLVILDGLQRTFTMLDLENELRDNNNLMNTFMANKIRVELYLGINKFGILYRMLTLNTGQTPMSIRHQIEMLYRDYLNRDFEGINLVSEVQNQNTDTIGFYKFKDVIEGFNSYLERNELPIDRFDILNNIKGLEKLSEEDQRQDIFVEFVKTYHKFICKVDYLSEGWVLEDTEDFEELQNITGIPFAKCAYKFFNKSQAMTGFGAAIGKLKDFQKLPNYEEVSRLIDNVNFTGEKEEWIVELILVLDKIKSNSKKIGNSQRMYFQFFFRELFNNDSDSYLVLNKAVKNAHQKYRSQME